MKGRREREGGKNARGEQCSLGDDTQRGKKACHEQTHRIETHTLARKQTAKRAESGWRL